MSIHINRKDEHVLLANKFYTPETSSDFDALKFVHHSLPQVNYDDISITTTVAGLTFDTPFFINGMTGGSENTYQINRDLATVARETGLAMASGSISAALKHPEVIKSYSIMREINPNGILFANLGAEHSVENGKRAVDILQANALQLHVNAAQELVMPEGGRQFDHWLNTIQLMVEQVGVPVIVKEVGFGMSRETIELLKSIGVASIDISGRGGTNFAAIENARRPHNDLDFLEDWGQSTVISLLEAYNNHASLDIIASGGIRTPLDMIKAYSLGAKSCGLSGQFLHLIQEKGIDETCETVTMWQEQLKTIMTLLGAQTLPHLIKSDIILSPSLTSWCQNRMIDTLQFSNRQKNTHA